MTALATKPPTATEQETEPRVGPGMSLDEAARGREMGRAAQSMRAKDLRALWWEEGIKLVMDGFNQGCYMHRHSLIEGIRSWNFAYQQVGKGGGNIQHSTVSRWLTREIEGEIKLEAIQRLLNRSNA